MQFLPGSSRIDTAIWTHYMDSNKTAGEEARRQLHKNAASYLEHVMPHISKVKLATIVEGDPKDPFSIATTPRCRGGRTCYAPYILWKKSMNQTPFSNYRVDYAL